MKKTLFSFIAILTLMTFVTSCAPISSTTAESSIRTIEVSGTGTVELEPDIARVNIGVRSQSPSVSEALAENSANAEAVIQRLLDLGVEQQDIKTQNLNIHRQQNQPGPEGEPADTFVVENTIAVTVRDLDSLGEILSAVVAEGANTIHGVTFDIEDRDAAIEEARSLAIADAQSQAEAIAEVADVELGSIQTINFDRSGSPAPQAAFEVEMAQGGSVPISSGQLTIQVTAKLIYRME